MAPLQWNAGVKLNIACSVRWASAQEAIQWEDLPYHRAMSWEWQLSQQAKQGVLLSRLQVEGLQPQQLPSQLWQAWEIIEGQDSFWLQQQGIQAMSYAWTNE